MYMHTLLHCTISFDMSHNCIIKKLAHTYSNYSKAINLHLCAGKTKIKVIISRKINICQQIMSFHV